MTRLHHLTASVVGLVAFILFAISPLTATVSTAQGNAQGKLPPYSGLDVLFLVDHSGSMNGYYQGGKLNTPASDPNQLRFEGPKYALQLLGVFRQSYSQSPNPPNIEMSVLGFGSRTRLVLNWTEIANSKLGDWDKVSQRLGDEISYLRFTGGDEKFELGLTDFQMAFDKGRQIFESLKVPTGERHLRAVFILTDGSPCTDAILAVTSCTLLPNQTITDHLKKLAENARVYFPDPDYQLYVTALDSGSNYWPFVETDWKMVVCPIGQQCAPDHTQQVKTPIEISTRFQSIVTELFNTIRPGAVTTRLLQAPYEFDVPPYSQTLNINIFKNNMVPLQNVRILQPDKSPFPAAPKLPDTAIESYSIVNTNDKPIVPGKWQVDIPTQNDIKEIQPSVQSISAQPKLIKADSLQKYAESTVQLQITDSSGLGLTRYANNAYPLTVTLKLYDATDPNPANRLVVGEPISMVLDDANQPTLNQFITNFRPVVAGKFEIRATASYEENGKPHEIFSDASVATVDIADAYVLWPGQLPGGSSQREKLPVQVSAEVKVKGTDQPIPTQNLVFQIVVSDDKGNKQQAQVIPNVSTIPGEVQSTFDGPPAVSGGITHYTADVQLGYIDNNTKQFVRLDAPPQAYALEVRPTRLLSVRISQPNKDGLFAQRFELLPRFFPNDPVSLQVELRNDKDEPVSLSDVSGGKEPMPSLVATSGNTRIDLSGKLIEQQPGIYTVVTDQIGQGDFTYAAQTATTNEQLVGDYQWATSAAAFKQNRWLHPGIPISLLSILATVLAGSAYGLYRRQVWIKLSTNPLKGTLSIQREIGGGDMPEVIFHRQLDSLRINFKRYRSRDGLPAPLHFIEVTTNNDATNSENRVFWVNKLHIADQKIDTPFPLMPGGVYPIQIEIVNKKDGSRRIDQYYISNGDDGGMFTI